MRRKPTCEFYRRACKTRRHSARLLSRSRFARSSGPPRESRLEQTCMRLPWCFNLALHSPTQQSKDINMMHKELVVEPMQLFGLDVVPRVCELRSSACARTSKRRPCDSSSPSHLPLSLLDQHTSTAPPPPHHQQACFPTPSVRLRGTWAGGEGG